MIQIKTWPTLPKTHTALTNDGWETTCLGALFVSGRVLSITHTLNDDPHIWSLPSLLKYPEWIWMRTHSLANTHVSWVVPGIFPLHRWLIGISVQTTWWSISPLGSFMPRNYQLQIIKYPQKAVWRILDKCQSLWTKLWAIIIQLSSTLLHLWPSSGWPRWRLCNDLVDLGLGGQRRGWQRFRVGGSWVWSYRKAHDLSKFIHALWHQTLIKSNFLQLKVRGGSWYSFQGNILRLNK